MKITKSELKNLIKEEALRLHKITLLENRSKEINKELKLLKEEWTSEFFDSNERVTRDDEFLKSFQYFVETYYNGVFSQLKRMLDEIVAEGEIENLIEYLENNTEKEGSNIKSWIIKNLT